MNTKPVNDVITVDENRQEIQSLLDTKPDVGGVK